MKGKKRNKKTEGQIEQNFMLTILAGYGNKQILVNLAVFIEGRSGNFVPNDGHNHWLSLGVHY